MILEYLYIFVQHENDDDVVGVTHSWSQKAISAMSLTCQAQALIARLPLDTAIIASYLSFDLSHKILFKSSISFQIAHGQAPADGLVSTKCF